MSDSNERLDGLFKKLQLLETQQDEFSKEIAFLRQEITKFTLSDETTSPESIPSEIDFSPSPESEFDNGDTEVGEDVSADTLNKSNEKPKALPIINEPPIQAKSSFSKSDFEKFIGENLINKIGIAITVIGVGIGAKYAIDHRMISPLTRIILGYFMGLGLLGVAIYLKKNYANFSAVLLSGALAILYFITYSAYAFYDIIPQVPAFALMLLFTIFTVIAALNYNLQVIAHVGLVGAYAVPFLLSDGSGRVVILFSYVGIINIGILFLALKKYWKPLSYSSFVLTWLIFASWFVIQYSREEHFALACLFLTLFFIIFYVSFLGYKLLKKEKFNAGDIVLILSNAFLYYGLGYALLSRHLVGEQLLGLFTLANAITHFAISAFIYKKQLADRNLFYLISGLVLVFITLAIPVQLDGNWVTILWGGEAALLFWIGRTKSVSIYEKLSYPLMILAFFSIFQDWESAYNIYRYELTNFEKITPLFNVHFLTSLLLIGAFGFINYIHFNKNFWSHQNASNKLFPVISWGLPTIFIVLLYQAFRMEINYFWDQLYHASRIVIPSSENVYESSVIDRDLDRYKDIWIINYSLLFATILSWINIRKLKNTTLGSLNLILNLIIIIVFLSLGLYALSELRDNFISSHLSEYYLRSSFSILIRYICYAFVAGLLIMSYFYIQQDFIKKKLQNYFDILLYIIILWIVSSELITWMELSQFTQSYKLGLSILWGVYSLSLISIGIWKKKKHVRLGAFILFGITLIKLFIYDISHLDTIAKTIVFVSLGILLLIISFLYNKYKLLISGEPENKDKHTD